MSHTYHFPDIWNGQAHDAVVIERHDIVLLFDATNCNPNGDPDTGNMPRLQPDTLRGLVTDVCLKRKVRNFFANRKTDGGLKAETEQPESRYHPFIREGAVIQTLVESPDLEQKAILAFKGYEVDGKYLTDDDWKRANSKGKATKEAAPEGDAAKKEKKKDKGLSEYRDRAYRDALCQTYFDVRFFGQVVSTEGPLKGSFYGQIRGPIQMAFSESLDKILQLDFSITRCAVANEAEAAKKDDDNRTMGRKHAVPYALYRCHIHFSPAFAAKTYFTYADLDNFLFALTRCLGDYNVDIASARAGGMTVVGLVDFQHKDSLGNAPAHKLFKLVKVQGKKVCVGEDGKPLNPQPKPETEGQDAFAGKWVFKSTGSEFPRSLDDYEGEAPEGELHVTKTGEIKPGRNGEGVAVIKANRIVWEIPKKQPNA